MQGRGAIPRDSMNMWPLDRGREHGTVAVCASCGCRWMVNEGLPYVGSSSRLYEVGFQVHCLHECFYASVSDSRAREFATVEHEANNTLKSYGLGRGGNGGHRFQVTRGRSRGPGHGANARGRSRVFR